MKQNHPSKHSKSQELVLNENGQMKKCLLKNIYENQVRRFAGWGLLSSSLRQSLHSRQEHRALSFLWPRLKVFSREEGGFAGPQLPAQHLPWTRSPGSVRCEWGLFPSAPFMEVYIGSAWCGTLEASFLLSWSRVDPCRRSKLRSPEATGLWLSSVTEKQTKLITESSQCLRYL